MNHSLPKSILTLTALLLLLSLPAVAQAPSTSLKLDDIFNLEVAADPQISPDGQRIVYVRQYSDVMTDKRYSNLWIINFDATNHRPLTAGNFHDSSPRWSPDGTRLVFVSDREGSPQLLLRWMDTGQTTKLTNLEYPPRDPSWSPDGKQIAFLSLVKGKAPSIASLPEPPQGAKWAEPATVIDKMVYRFNGVGYLPYGYQHVFVVPAEGGTPRQITSGNFNHGDIFFRPTPPVWTPDGKYLLLSANRHDDPDFDPLNAEVYEFSLADGSVRALTSRQGPDSSPALSPDGKAIAYTGFDDRYQGYQITRLYLMNRDGTGSRVVTPTLERDVNSPIWAADGSGIYFLYDDQGNTKLGFYSLTGSLKPLASSVGGGGSAYSFGASFSLARNGNIAFTYTRPDIPGDIAVLNATEGRTRTLTAVNEDLLSQRKLGQVEEIWYDSSLDKRKVHGWIIKPPDFDPSKKYPLILEIHGGPFANYGDRFDIEKQMWAAQGYVVLYVNPRGSTSYGEEFGNLIHHAYPGDDFFDLNSGVDAVIAKGYIDTANLFVTGGSGGGVLTCWMIGRTDRFRAAVSAYPVINWYSFVLTADIPIFVIKYWFPGLPWDYTEQYMKRSLLSVVKNVKTPTMVITGEEDYRTPMSESEQYYLALKLLKVDSVLVRVPGEAHGIWGRPSHLMAKLSNIVGWFNRYRK